MTVEYDPPEVLGGLTRGISGKFLSVGVARMCSSK